MRVLAILLALVWAVPAWGQQAPPYTPITLDEATYTQFRAWLMEQPAKFALPVLQLLDGELAKARAAKAKAEPPK